MPLSVTHTITKHIGEPPATPFKVWFEVAHTEPVRRKGFLKVEINGKTYSCRGVNLEPFKPLSPTDDRRTAYADVDLPAAPAPGSVFKWRFDGEAGKGEFTEKFEKF